MFASKGTLLSPLQPFVQSVSGNWINILIFFLQDRNRDNVLTQVRNREFPKG